MVVSFQGFVQLSFNMLLALPYDGLRFLSPAARRPLWVGGGARSVPGAWW
jgi:hypothetical protein